MRGFFFVELGDYFWCQKVAKTYFAITQSTKGTTRDVSTVAISHITPGRGHEITPCGRLPYYSVLRMTNCDLVNDSTPWRICLVGGSAPKTQIQRILKTHNDIL